MSPWFRAPPRRTKPSPIEPPCRLPAPRRAPGSVEVPPRSSPSPKGRSLPRHLLAFFHSPEGSWVPAGLRPELRPLTPEGTCVLHPGLLALPPLPSTSGFERARLRPSSVTPRGHVYIRSPPDARRLSTALARAWPRIRPGSNARWEIPPDRRLQSIYWVIKGGLESRALQLPRDRSRSFAVVPLPLRIPKDPSLRRAVPTVPPKRLPLAASSRRSPLPVLVTFSTPKGFARDVRRHVRVSVTSPPNELVAFDLPHVHPKTPAPSAERERSRRTSLDRASTPFPDHRWSRLDVESLRVRCHLRVL